MLADKHVNMSRRHGQRTSWHQTSRRQSAMQSLNFIPEIDWQLRSVPIIARLKATRCSRLLGCSTVSLAAWGKVDLAVKPDAGARWPQMLQKQSLPAPDVFEFEFDTRARQICAELDHSQQISNSDIFQKNIRFHCCAPAKKTLRVWAGWPTSSKLSR